MPRRRSTSGPRMWSAEALGSWHLAADQGDAEARSTLQDALHDDGFPLGAMSQSHGYGPTRLLEARCLLR